MTGILHEDSAHGFRRCAEKVRAPPPVLPVGILQTQPRFVDQGGRLKRLSGPLLRHFVRCQPAQFPIDQREQLVARVQIARLKGVEQLGDVGHRRRG